MFLKFLVCKVFYELWSVGSLCECTGGVRGKWRKRRKQGEGNTPSCGVRVSACGKKEHYVTSAPPHVGVWVTSKCQRERESDKRREWEIGKAKIGAEEDGEWNGRRGEESGRKKQKKGCRRERCAAFPLQSVLGFKGHFKGETCILHIVNNTNIHSF